MPYRLTPQQRAFFEVFGFLRVPGLFARDADRLSRAFDEVFATARTSARGAAQEISLADASRSAENESLGRALGQTPIIDTYHHVNFDGHRALVPSFLEASPDLAGLRDDPRITGIVADLLGPVTTYVGSDGHLFDCDTAWHWESYGAPLDQLHIKLLFYLDPVDATHGALRVLPGTSHHADAYASELRSALFDQDRIADALGVSCEQIPNHAVESRPGDLLVANFRTMHAAFGGRPGRRLFTVNFRQDA